MVGFLSTLDKTVLDRKIAPFKIYINIIVMDQCCCTKKIIVYVNFFVNLTRWHEEGAIVYLTVLSVRFEVDISTGKVGSSPTF